MCVRGINLPLVLRFLDVILELCNVFVFHVTAKLYKLFAQWGIPFKVLVAIKHKRTKLDIYLFFYLIRQSADKKGSY
jgi:hypothetical protein